MKMERKDWLKLYVISALVFAALMYSRPLSFAEIMPGLDLNKETTCEAVYEEQSIGENGGVRYTTVTKSFAVGSEDYEQLMELLHGVTYRKQLAVALTGGRRGTGYSISYPHSEIYFTQDKHIYRYCLWNEYLPAGPIGDMWDYRPKGGRDFHQEVTEFVRTHGLIVNEEVQQY